MGRGGVAGFGLVSPDNAGFFPCRIWRGSVIAACWHRPCVIILVAVSSEGCTQSVLFHRPEKYDTRYY